MWQEDNVMNPAKSGLATTGKVGIAVVLVLLVLGVAYVYASLYVAGFSLIRGLSDNGTILSLLKQTSQNTTSFGPTPLLVTTYSLANQTAPYTSLTVGFATIPGTNTKFAVYYDAK